MTTTPPLDYEQSDMARRADMGTLLDELGDTTGRLLAAEGRRQFWRGVWVGVAAGWTVGYAMGWWL